MLTLTQRKSANSDTSIHSTLALTAIERTRSRHRFEMSDGNAVFLRLPRGTVLQNGDILSDETSGICVKIIAKPEPVLTVTSPNYLNLLKAAYHLGNRHVPCELTANYLRLSPDSVLQTMLEHLGLKVKEELTPFFPEAGAYANAHHH